MAFQVLAPYPIFADTDGTPLDGGYIYLGTEGQNPEVSPVTVYWDAALTQVAPQPIRTVNGAPSNSGAPAAVYTAADCSITIRDSAMRLVITNTSGNINSLPSSEITMAIMTRAVALAANVPAEITLLRVFHGGVVCEYIRDANGTALTSGDGQTWSPAGGIATPAHWGALSGYANDATTETQACLDWAKNSTYQYDTDLNAWTSTVDLRDQVWRTTATLDMTNIRQQGFRIGRGTIFGDFTGGAVLEAFGCNHLEILDTLRLEAPLDETNCPEFGLCIGRCDDGSGNRTATSPGHRGRIRIEGCYSKAALLDIASETTALMLYINNLHPNATAYCYFAFGHMQDYVDIYGAALTSSFCTLPTVGDGAISNILDSAIDGEILRNSLWNVTITGITQANPAVVSFSSTAAASANMANGQAVYVSDGGGMDELDARSFTLASLSVAGDGLSGSFALSGEDSTGHTAYSSGGAAHRGTGPAIKLGRGSATKIIPASFVLAHYDVAISLHVQNGPVNQFEFRGQVEKVVANPVEIDVGSGSQAIQGMTLDFLSDSQPMTAPLKLTGSGSVDLRDLKLTVNTQAAAFPDELCTNGGNLTVRNADIRVPNALDVSGLAAFTGTVQEQSPQASHLYASKTNKVTLTGGEFTLNDQALATTGSATQTELRDVSDAVNTTNKEPGKIVFDSTNTELVYATGTTAGAAWRKTSDNLVAHTPQE